MTTPFHSSAATAMISATPPADPILVTSSGQLVEKFSPRLSGPDARAELAMAGVGDGMIGGKVREKLWSRRGFLAAAGAAGLVAMGARSSPAAGNISRYARAVLAKKPVGYWRLGESRGPSALDSSGYAHNGFYRGTPVFGERGAIHGDDDTAVKFDGQGSYVEVPSHEDFSQPTSGMGMTVEAWLRPDALEFAGETADPYVHWLGKGQANGYEWALRFYSRTSRDRPNRISAYLFNPAGGLGAGAYFQDTLQVGEWIHVVACFDPGDAGTPGAGVRIFKNGILRLGPPKRGTLYGNPQWQIKPVHGPAPLRFGTRDLKSFLTGALDEVAIYPRVLTAREILENYNAATMG